MSNKLSARVLLGALIALTLMIFGVVIGVTAMPLAQDTLTPTPTITSPAIGWIPTILPLTPPTFTNILCPPVTPYGYGTVTPNALWSAYCGQCVDVTQIASPQATPSPTDAQSTMTQTIIAMTATRTRTPTPVVSPTATNTPTTKLTVSTPGWPSCWYGWALPDAWSYVCSQYYNGVKCVTSIRNYPPGDFCLRGEWQFSDSRGGGTQQYWYRTDGYAGGTYVSTGYPYLYGAMSRTGLSVGSGENVVGIGEYHDNGTSSSSSRYMGIGAAQHYNKTSIWDNTTYIYPFAGIPPTPTAGPTPNAGSYCSTVDGSTYNAFSLSSLTLGIKYCVDIGNWSYSILGVAIDIPWIAHLCLQDVSFGTATILGVVISLDTIVTIAVIAWATRNLFIS